MISWIQITFQKHFRVFFLVLLVFIIVSFVIYFAPGMGLGMGSVPRAQPRPFFGANLGSEEDSQRLFGDASLSVFLQAGGYPPLDQNRMQEYALMRHAGLYLARQLNLPGPTSAELGEFIQGLGAFAGPQGQFDAARYQEFRDTLKTNPQISEGDITRVLADDFRYQRVQQLLAGPGYVLPSEVKEQLARAETSWTLAVARVDYAGFVPTVAPSDADLAQFFEDNSFRYEIPPQVRTRFTEFSAASFLHQVNVTEAEVRNYYQANSFRFPKPEDAGTTPAVGAEDPTEAAFTAVRSQVEAAVRFERAQRLAMRAASDLSLALFDARVPMSEVDSFLAARDLTAKPLGAFGVNSVPAEFGGNPQVAAEALRLNAQRHFTDALPTPTGSAVLFWEESIPSRIPFLAEVRAQVVADFTEDAKRKRFIELGRALREALTARLKAGESFDQAATAAAASTGLTVEVQHVPAFTLQQPPADLDNAALGGLDALAQGDVSEMIISGEHGLLVHAVSKQLPDTSENNPQFGTMRSQIAQFTGARNASEYLRELVDSELTKTAPVLP